MVLSRLLGGGKKRKKKVYTTPKKIKHKRKKVKLSVLKFYEVSYQYYSSSEYRYRFKIQELEGIPTDEQRLIFAGIFSIFSNLFCSSISIQFIAESILLNPESVPVMRNLED